MPIRIKKHEFISNRAKKSAKLIKLEKLPFSPRKTKDVNEGNLAKLDKLSTKRRGVGGERPGLLTPIYITS